MSLVWKKIPHFCCGYGNFYVEVVENFTFLLLDYGENSKITILLITFDAFSFINRCKLCIFAILIRLASNS